MSPLKFQLQNVVVVVQASGPASFVLRSIRVVLELKAHFAQTRGFAVAPCKHVPKNVYNVLRWKVAMLDTWIDKSTRMGWGWNNFLNYLSIMEQEHWDFAELTKFRLWIYLGVYAHSYKNEDIEILQIS